MTSTLYDLPFIHHVDTIRHLNRRKAMIDQDQISVPDRYPDYGSWPGRFRKFVAAFNMDNMDLINPVEVISLFVRNDEKLEQLVAGLSEVQLAKKHPKKDWSIRDHVAHFFDVQEMLDARLDLTLKHEDPELTALAIYEKSTEEGRAAITEDMLAKFLDLHAQSIRLLEGLPLRDL